MRVKPPTFRAFLCAAACLLLITALVPLTARQGEEGDRAEALRVFNTRISDYASLHRRLEGPLPPLSSRADPVRNYMSRQLLASAIRKARADAQQGDIFNPAVSRVLRRLIVDVMKGRDLNAFVSELDEGGAERHPQRPLINEPLPKGTTHEVPCVLLQALPALPDDVEYRIVGRDLVLWTSMPTSSLTCCRMHSPLDTRPMLWRHGVSGAPPMIHPAWCLLPATSFAFSYGHRTTPWIVIR